MSGTRQQIEVKTTKTRSYEEWKEEVDSVDEKIKKIESGKKLNMLPSVIEVQELKAQVAELKSEGDATFTVTEDQASNTTHADLYRTNPNAFNYMRDEVDLRQTLVNLEILSKEIDSQKKPEQGSKAEIEIEFVTQINEEKSKHTVSKKEIPIGKIHEWQTNPPTATSAKDRVHKSKIDACDEYAKHLEFYIEKKVNQLNDQALYGLIENSFTMNRGLKTSSRKKKIDLILSLLKEDVSGPISNEPKILYYNLSIHFKKCGKYNVAMAVAAAVEKYKLVYELRQSKSVEAFNKQLATHAPLLIKHRDSGTKRFLKGVGFAASVVASVATLGLFTPLAYLAYDRFYGYSKTHGARFVNEASKDVRKQQEINATRKKNK